MNKHQIAEAFSQYCENNGIATDGQMADEIKDVFEAGCAVVLASRQEPAITVQPVSESLKCPSCAAPLAPPTGFVLVPIEPTKEILDALYRNESDASSAWFYALEAASQKGKE